MTVTAFVFLLIQASVCREHFSVLLKILACCCSSSKSITTPPSLWCFSIGRGNDYRTSWQAEVPQLYVWFTDKSEYGWMQNNPSSLLYRGKKLICNTQQKTLVAFINSVFLTHRMTCQKARFYNIAGITRCRISRMSSRRRVQFWFI